MGCALHPFSFPKYGTGSIFSSFHPRPGVCVIDILNPNTLQGFTQSLSPGASLFAFELPALASSYLADGRDYRFQAVGRALAENFCMPRPVYYLDITSPPTSRYLPYSWARPTYCTLYRIINLILKFHRIVG